MQKVSQRRGLLNRLREKVDLPGKLTEKYFNPEFKTIMENLRNMDDQIRSIALGTKFGDADVPSDSISMKALIKSAAANANNREYMKAVADLGRFHKKMIEIINLLSSFTHNVDTAHEKFLFNDLDDESKSHLQSFKDRWSPKSATVKSVFVKESGIIDFFTDSDWNKARERRSALTSWEKRYPNKIKELKKDTNSIINESGRMLNVLLATLEKMDKARSSRSPEDYIIISNKIVDAFKKYDDGESGFKKYYEKNIKGFLEKQQFFAPTKVDDTSKPAELGKQDVGAQPKVAPTVSDMLAPGPGNTIPAGPMPGAIPALNQSPEVPSLTPATPFELSNTMPNPPPEHQSSPLPAPPPTPGSVFKMTPEEKRVFEAQHGFSGSSHTKFYDSLKKMSNESPAILAMYIAKYAKSIQSKDPVVAIQLFKIAKSIDA